MIDKFVSSSDVASVLKLTTQRVNQLAKDGIIKREADGKFNLSEAVDCYYAFKYKTDEELNFEREHTLLEKAKRETAEIELAKLRGQMHAATDIEFVMTNMLTVFRNRILGVPSKLAPIITGLQNTNKIKEFIDKELRQCLTELSDYDPSLFIGEGEIEVEEDETEVIQDISKNSKDSSAAAESNSK